MILTVEFNQSPRSRNGLRVFHSVNEKGNHESSEFGITAVSTPAILPNPAFAVPDCIAHIPSTNKQMASHLGVIRQRAIKNVILHEFGNIVDPLYDHSIHKLDTYTLKEPASEKLSYLINVDSYVEVGGPHYSVLCQSSSLGV